MKDIQKLINDAERADAVASLMDGVNPHNVLELADRLAKAEAQLVSVTESRDQWKANAHEFSRCADRLEAQLAESTAEPVKVPDELTMRDAIRLNLSVDWAAGYNTAIAHCKELSEPIDNTAQQYEALAGWKLVPVEPTAEMLAAYYDKSIAPISRLSIIGYRAMLEAVPKPEDKR